MEWVETTGRSVEEAKEHALDQLGVAADDAEFEILEEPRPGLFGRVRGTARVRARVRPARPRPKAERRERRGRAGKDSPAAPAADETPVGDARDGGDAPRKAASNGRRSSGPGTGRGRGESAPRQRKTGGRPATDPRPSERAGSDQKEQHVDAEQVGAEAQKFVQQLVDAFGLAGVTTMQADGIEIEVNVAGDDLGLLVGPRGSTLLAIQDLARVAAQRRLGDHDTRLRVDVAGYRERRREALSRFAAEVAAQVAESGVPRALEPMPSADRKVIHDVLTTDTRVATRSEGEDPFRRIVIAPADA